MQDEKQQKLGVVVVLLDKTKTKVLLGKRLNSYKAGWLGLPGGRVDVGEPLVNCAKPRITRGNWSTGKEYGLFGSSARVSENV